MKRVMLFMMSLLLVFTLTACSKEPTTYEKNGFLIDTEAGTITKGEDVYTFTITGRDRSHIKITYPNGATYFWVWQGNGGHGGWSDDYDPERYIDGDALMELISFEPPQERKGNPLIGLLLIVLGLANAIAPEAAWYLNYGWWFKNAEPSDAAIAFGRIGGCAAVFFGILLLIL